MATKDQRDADYDAWLNTLTLNELQSRLTGLGVTRAVIKRLSDHQDNSKNQFYWQGDLTENPLPLAPFEEFTTSSKKKSATGIGYKAKMDFRWLTKSGSSPAPAAQVIHYPQYPETRLGSLLQGAEIAPRTLLAGRESAIPGRLLLLGVAEGRIYAIALPPASPATGALLHLFGESPFAHWPLASHETLINVTELLEELRGVFDLCPVRGCRVSQGDVLASTARNAAGTTLETLLGVMPNSLDQPDFHGWELKAHHSSRITLMTPAPTGGLVRDLAPEEFMRKFGWRNEAGTRWDYNGSHRATRDPEGKATTRLVLTPYEVQLVHRVTEETAMSWRIADLLTHWSRKHTRAAYVRYDGNASSGFSFGPWVQLGQGINWRWFIQALHNGTILLDPAYNLKAGARRMKERAQFRCDSHEIAALYPSVTLHDVRHFEPSRRLALAGLKGHGLELDPTALMC